MVGLLNPAALWCGALYAVLIALYLWERRRDRLEVPSLLLWQVVPAATPRTRRFRADLLFVLQCLALTLLLASAVQPYWRGAESPQPSARHVLVIDASASMQARESRRTRFAQAIDLARQRLRVLPARTEVMLIAAGQRPDIAMPFSDDHRAVDRALAHLRPTDTHGNLDLSLAVVRSTLPHSPVPVSIEVFTDLPASAVDARWRESVGFAHVGETDNNLAITGLHVMQGRLQDHRATQAQVRVENFAHSPAHGGLTVELEGQTIRRGGFTLLPREARVFFVHDLPAPGLLHARLDAEDALDVDDHAYAWVQPLQPATVLVVTASPVLEAELRRVGDATGALAFLFTSPGHYAPDLAARADAVVLHRFTPTEAPDRPTLEIFPEPRHPRCAGETDHPELEILDWNDRHVVLAGVQPLLPHGLGPARALTCAPWADPLLLTRSGEREAALACAGVEGGHRRACLGFDLAETGLLAADNINLLPFVLNLLEWLTATEPAVAILKTGEVYAPHGLPRRAWRVEDPTGTETHVPADQPLAVELRHAGAYVVHTDGTTRRAFANLFDPSESDIGRGTREAAIPPAALAGSGLDKGGRALAHWLGVIAAVVLAGEWLAAYHRAR